jgi:hypothetical protein
MRLLFVARSYAQVRCVRCVLARRSNRAGSRGKLKAIKLSVVLMSLVAIQAACRVYHSLRH